MIDSLTLYFPELISVLVIVFFAMCSPGPDMALVIRNSISGSRESGFFTALGVASGLGFHITYSLLGVGVFITQIPTLFLIFKIAAFGFLVFLGVNGLLAKQYSQKSQVFDRNHKPLSRKASFMIGLLTNILNPKVMLLFISLFIMVISPNTPMEILILYGVLMTLVSLIFHCSLSFIFSTNRVVNTFYQYAHWIDRIFGALLITIAIQTLFVSTSWGL